MNKLILLCVILCTACCTKKANKSNANDLIDTSCINSEQAILVNRTGLDGCGWLLDTEKGVTLEPTNLHEFNITLKDTKKVTISYTIQHDMMGICMAGDIVKLTCITEY